MTAAGSSRHAVAAVLTGVLAGVSSGGSSRGLAAAGDTLLSGRVVSSTGERLAGVPVRARRTHSTIAVKVYTNGEGNYDFPEWSDLGRVEKAPSSSGHRHHTGQVSLPGGRLDHPSGGAAARA